MSDIEWEHWKEEWDGAAGALPGLRAAARRSELRQRVATALFVALIAAGSALNISSTVAGQTDPITCIVLVSWGVGVCAALLWMQRGARLLGSAGPREAVALLERRVQVERQVAQLLRWAYGGGILFVAIHYRGLFGDDVAAKWIARGIALAALSITVTAPWWVRRFTDRQQAELVRWRRWIEEQQL